MNRAAIRKNRECRAREGQARFLALAAAGMLACTAPEPHPEPSLARLLFAEHELPDGCTLLPADTLAPFPNPTLSGDRKFVASFVAMLSEDTVDSGDVEEVLFSVYVEEAEVGLFAFRLASTERARTFLQRLPAFQDSTDRSRAYHAGAIAAWLWHDGVSPACWSSMQDLVRERLAGDQ